MNIPHYFALQIRRAFIVFRLMTILEEARYSLIIIEHDPLLYEDTGGEDLEEMQKYNRIKER
jgi:hypothetical protein